MKDFKRNQNEKWFDLLTSINHFITHCKTLGIISMINFYILQYMPPFQIWQETFHMEGTALLAQSQLQFTECVRWRWVDKNSVYRIRFVSRNTNRFRVLLF